METLRTIAVTATLMLSLYAPAKAQTAPILCPHPTTREQGMWLDLQTARQALVCLQNEPRAMDRVRLLDENLRLADQERSALRIALTSAENEAVILRAQLDRMTQQARNAHDELSIWWRSPWLWFVFGAVLSAGVSVALVFAR